MAGYPMRARIVIDFRSYWFAGTGGGAGRQSDVRCYRDQRGLPAMPMSQVKGTLRESAERLSAAGSALVTDERIERLFGGRSDQGTGRPA